MVMVWFGSAMAMAMLLCCRGAMLMVVGLGGLVLFVGGFVFRRVSVGRVSVVYSMTRVRWDSSTIILGVCLFRRGSMAWLD